jgi:hypothetical protein
MLSSVLQSLVTANVIPCSLILFALIMEAIISSETSVITRVTGPHVPEDGVLHSHSCENLRSEDMDTRDIDDGVIPTADKVN